jgi:hypothetical protein
VYQLDQIPDAVIYEAFFRRVSFTEDLAKKSTAQGLDGAGVLRRLQGAAGLQDTQMQVLRDTVADWQAKRAAADLEAKPLLAVARAQKSASGPPPSDAQQRLQEWRERREQIVRDAMERLRTAFGSPRFFFFDAYVRRTSTVRGWAVEKPAPKQP